MVQKYRSYVIDGDFLKQYQKMSLSNSSSLLKEAILLFKNGYNARGYFLACVSMEETGKAYQAFSARGRNLNNPAVQNKIKESFEDHGAKMAAAMVCMMNPAAPDPDKIEYLTGLSVQLLHGREKSMYVDVVEANRITNPEQVVREKAASDTIRLAGDCFKTTAYYLSNNRPEKYQPHHDKFFVINKRTANKMLDSKDFWYYYLDLMRTKKTNDLSFAAAKYHDEFYSSKGSFFKKINPFNQ